jgi:ABC-2 type transport system permease protein
MPMRKILVIALRDYNAAVRSKAFLVSLLLLPVLMGGTFVVQFLLKDVKDTKPKKYAVLDHTPGGAVFKALDDAAKERKEKNTQPEFKLEKEEPAGDLAEQRLQLSEQVRQRTYQGFLEIGADVCKLPDSDDPPVADNRVVRFQSNNPLTREFPSWAEREINKKVRDLRAGKNLEKVAQPVPLQRRGLSRPGPNGDGPPVNFIASFLVPVILVMMMFMMIFVGATPLMQGVVEEKMQRISEVLLGSVPPFQLMLGKLLGTVGVATTLAAVYLGSGFLGALYYGREYGLSDFLTLPVLAWFLAFLTLGVLMYGSLFVAIGAACTSTQEAQTLLMPVLLTTLLLVWAAGRIFRVGILMQGKGANLAEMMKWVFRG